MNTKYSLLARSVVVIVLLEALGGCVSPAARVPCDGRLEAINQPAQKKLLSTKAGVLPVPKVSP